MGSSSLGDEKLGQGSLGLEARLRHIVEDALSEDLGMGDPTTDALIPTDWRGKGSILAKASGVVAGLPVAQEVFRQVDPNIKFHSLITDGASVRPGDMVATLEGPLGSILKGERTALNFLQRMSGIATETTRYTEAVASASGGRARIVDTRKTAPGLRFLDKYAVVIGGGQNHRHNLADGILIKDNHLTALASRGLTLSQTVEVARKRAPHTLRIEVEVETAEQAQEAAEAGADIILLDNMPPEEMRRAVQLIGGRALTEASGGITLATVRAVAETGVDLISVGSLTHSVKALDLSLEISPLLGTWSEYAFFIL